MATKWQKHVKIDVFIDISTSKHTIVQLEGERLDRGSGQCDNAATNDLDEVWLYFTSPAMCHSLLGMAHWLEKLMDPSLGHTKGPTFRDHTP